MLTDPYIQQLVHLIKRVKDEDKAVLNHSNNHDGKFTRNVINKIKSHHPFTQVPITITKIVFSVYVHCGSLNVNGSLLTFLKVAFILILTVFPNLYSNSVITVLVNVLLESITTGNCPE